MPGCWLRSMVPEYLWKMPSVCPDFLPPPGSHTTLGEWGDPKGFKKGTGLVGIVWSAFLGGQSSEAILERCAGELQTGQVFFCTKIRTR